MSLVFNRRKRGTRVDICTVNYERPPSLPPDKKSFFNSAETLHADWPWWVNIFLFPDFRETNLLWVYGVPTRPRSADLPTRGELLKKSGVACEALFLIMSDFPPYRPPYRPPDKKSFFNSAETLHADWSWWVNIFVFLDFRETNLLWVYGVPTRPRSADLPMRGELLKTFLDYERVTSRPPDLPPDRPQKGCLILLELGTPTGHDGLLFLYFRISARQECCEFTECRLKGTVFFFPRKRWLVIHSFKIRNVVFFFREAGKKKKQTLRKRWKAIFS